MVARSVEEVSKICPALQAVVNTFTETFGNIDWAAAPAAAVDSVLEGVGRDIYLVTARQVILRAAKKDALLTLALVHFVLVEPDQRDKLAMRRILAIVELRLKGVVSFADFHYAAKNAVDTLALGERRDILVAPDFPDKRLPSGHELIGALALAFELQLSHQYVVLNETPEFCSEFVKQGGSFVGRQDSKHLLVEYRHLVLAQSLGAKLEQYLNVG